jgi:hypothetical protein
MNVLFPPVAEEEEIVRHGQPGNNVLVNHELRFNGDRQAFVNADFQDFYSLLSGNVIWLNRNILACNEEMSSQLFSFFIRITPELRQQF